MLAGIVNWLASALSIPANGGKRLKPAAAMIWLEV